MKKSQHIGLAIFAVVLLIDQYTKYLISSLAVSESLAVFPGLAFTYVQNTGIVWGKMQGANTILIWVSIIAVIALLYFRDEFKRQWEQVAYVLILSGLVGNFIDRVFRGFVVDFIDLGWWPVFNIADSAISVGILLFIVTQFHQNSSKSSKRSK